MTRRETSSEIDEAAADWAARLDRGTLSTDEKARLDAWAAADIRRAGALARALAVLTHFDRARALGPQTSLARRTLRNPLRMQRRAFLAGGSIAASVGVLAVLAPSLASTREFKTAVGEVRSIPLEDGSVVWLNTESRVRIDYKANRRGVTLLAGEALFEVAKDPARPFIVAARDADVRAVGTSFTVSRLPGRPVEVLVREGIVELGRPRGEPSPKLRLTAGAQAWAPETGALRSSLAGDAAVARALSWRSGMLDFDGVTLADAARTFARYSDQRILIADPTVAQRSVTGRFASTDPGGFARAVALSLNLRTRSDEGVIYLSR